MITEFEKRNEFHPTTTQIAPRLELIERADCVELVANVMDVITHVKLDDIQAITLRNKLTSWKNSKTSRDKKK